MSEWNLSPGRYPCLWTWSQANSCRWPYLIRERVKLEDFQRSLPVTTSVLDFQSALFWMISKYLKPAFVSVSNWSTSLHYREQNCIQYRKHYNKSSGWKEGLLLLFSGSHLVQKSQYDLCLLCNSMILYFHICCVTIISISFTA